MSLQYNNSFSEKHQSCVCTTVTLSHRFKAFSSPFAGKTGFDMNRRNFLQSYFRQSFESFPGVQRFANLWCAFWFFLHNAKRINPSPFRELPRFRKPRISSPQRQLRTATIKTFLRKFRGFANLESAHRSRSFAQCAYVQLFYCMSVSAPSGGIPT